MKKYIKMNNNDNYLSLGNLFRIIKEISKNTSNSIQTEIFCLLFETESINTTTVNNYCVGSRSIGNDYKQKYLSFQKKYSKDKEIFTSMIINLINHIDGIYYNVLNKIEFINNNKSFKLLVNKLFLISKNDRNITNDIINNYKELMDNNDYYQVFVKLLFYIILENKQPIYEEDRIKETINDLISNTNISINHIEDILEVELKEGLSYYRSLRELGKKSNPYALYKLARMEYLGQVDGHKNIDRCLEYLKESAQYNHPASLWMIAYLMINKEISDIVDYKLVWEYLNKAYKLGSVASINTMGVCYMNGWTIDGRKHLSKALECFNEAGRLNYVYSLNNLGKYYEKKDNVKAFEYYLKSANLGDSWACNKVGEIYRNKKDYVNAFNYYQRGSKSSLNEICHYNNYNLAKYFYLCGCDNIMLPKDITIAINLLEKESPYLIEASILLLEIYVKEYLKNKDDSFKDKIMILKNKIEINSKYNDAIKKEIEKKISEIKKINSINLDIN